MDMSTPKIAIDEVSFGQETPEDIADPETSGELYSMHSCAGIPTSVSLDF
jgi:hypothetical protein